MKSALLLIDIQNDYFPGGKNELFQPEQAAAKAQLLLEYFRKRGLPVFHVQHISVKSDSSFFLPETEGVKINSLVSPKSEEMVLVKHAPNAFLNTGLEQLLHAQNIERLVICGMMSHMCVDSTVRAAKDAGFSVLLPEDACTTKDLNWGGNPIPAPTVHQAFMAALSGSFAQIIETKDLLDKGFHCYKAK